MSFQLALQVNRRAKEFNRRTWQSNRRTHKSIRRTWESNRMAHAFNEIVKTSIKSLGQIKEVVHNSDKCADPSKRMTNDQLLGSVDLRFELRRSAMFVALRLKFSRSSGGTTSELCRSSGTPGLFLIKATNMASLRDF